MRTMRRQRIIAIVNRTCRPLEVMDDGIPVTLKPGYRRLGDGRVVGADPNGNQPAMEHVPIATANRAMDQNKARGTVNPDDRLDCVFLIGRVGADDISFVEDDPDPEREMIDRDMLPESQRAERMNTRVSRRRTRADRTLGAGMGTQVLATSDGRIRSNAGGFDGGSSPREGHDA